MGEFGYIRSLGDYWGLFGIKLSARVRDALSDVEQDKYKAERAARDILGVYNDVLEAFAKAISMQPPVPENPPATAVVKKGSPRAIINATLGLAAGTVLTSSDLVGGQSPKIPSSQIVAPPVGASGEVTVTVQGISTAGIDLYRGNLKDPAGNVVLALQLYITK